MLLRREWQLDRQGNDYISRCASDALVGEGARWSADRQSAWRLRDGKGVESISLEEAARIAAALGLPVPRGGTQRVDA